MRVHVIAVPYDTARLRWRMGAGPEHLLSAGLEARLGGRGHTVTSVVVEPSRPELAEIATAFDLMARVADEVRGAVDRGDFPLVLSGNCNTAAGTLAGLTPRRRAVLWFDAHGDVNTPETTTTGFLDGTGLAAAMGWCWKGMTKQVPGFAPVDPQDVLLLGARDLDPDEAALIERGAVRRLLPAEINDGTLECALSALPADCAAYVHCDLDVLDPAEGRANPFPVPGGLEVAGLERAIAGIGRARPIAAAAVTAYAPEYDGDGRIAEAAMRVAEAIISSVRPA